MKASIVDLRYNMKDVLKALDRNEEVTILYRGKVKATIVPKREKSTEQMKNHPFVGMLQEDARSTDDIMRALRKGRYDDL